MSLSSPCSGARPYCSTKRWISSNPAMMRSSRGERPPRASGWAKSSSSARSSSRSRSLIATLILEVNEGSGAFGHPLFPSVRRTDGGEPAALLFEFDGADSQFLRFLRCQNGAFGGNRRRDLLQTVLAHRFGEDGVGFAERIDAVDKVNIQFAHVHRKPAHAVNQRGVGARFSIAAATAKRNLFGLLGQVESGDGVLTHGLPIFLVEFGIFVFDDLAHADLCQLLRHKLFV